MKSFKLFSIEALKFKRLHKKTPSFHLGFWYKIVKIYMFLKMVCIRRFLSLMLSSSEIIVSVR